MPQFVHSPAEGHLDCFQFLATMNYECCNPYHKQVLCGCKFPNLFDKYLKVGLLGLMAGVCLTFKNLPFHKALASLRIPTSSDSVPVAPRPCQHWVFSGFWILAILIGLQRYVTEILTCIFLVTYDVEHLFIGLLPSIFNLVAYFIEF